MLRESLNNPTLIIYSPPNDKWTPKKQRDRDGVLERRDFPFIWGQGGLGVTSLPKKYWKWGLYWETVGAVQTP